MSKSNRSRGSEFLHDLITVDFDKVDIHAGVRFATLLAPLLVLGIITKHETSLVILGTVYVLAINEFLPTGQRTRILLSVSVLYASIFAIGMLLSMVVDLVIPLLTLGLFFISYFKVFSAGFMVLNFAGLLFVIGGESGIPTGSYRYFVDVIEIFFVRNHVSIWNLIQQHYKPEKIFQMKRRIYEFILIDSYPL